MSSSRILLSGVLAALASTTCVAKDVPKESGFSGYVQLNYSYAGVENNEVAGIGIGGYQDFTRSRINSIYTSPNGVTEGLPGFAYNFSYTFDSRTELFLGREVVDAVRFDFTQQLGVRQELADKSNLSIAYVFSGIPTKVWEDPYVAGTSRNKTDRTASGLRLGYGRILGSQTYLQYTYRKIDIDKERSGQALGLTNAQRSLLKRDGDQGEFRLGYNFDMGNDVSLVPEIIYTDDNRDGHAMKNSQWGAQLTYASKGERFNTVLTGGYSTADYDKANPIYGTTRNDDTWGVGGTLFDKELLRSLGKGWLATVTAGYYETDSNTDFYDSQLWTMGVGAMYRF
jgi:Protein of unknown function (DUF2860)